MHTVQYIECLSISGGPVSQLERRHLPSLVSEVVKDLQKKEASVSFLVDHQTTRVKVYITSISADDYYCRWMNDWLTNAKKTPLWKQKIREVRKVGHFALDNSGSGDLRNRRVVVCVEMVDESFALLIRDGQDENISVDQTILTRLPLVDETQLTTMERAPWIKRLGARGEGVSLFVSEAAKLSQEETRNLQEEWKELLRELLWEAMRRDRTQKEGHEQQAGKVVKPSFNVAGPSIVATTNGMSCDVKLMESEDKNGSYIQSAVCGEVNRDGTGGPYLVAGTHFLEVKLNAWAGSSVKDRFGTVVNSTHWRDAGVGIVARDYDPRGSDAQPAGKSAHGWVFCFFTGQLYHDNKQIDWRDSKQAPLRLREGDVIGLALDVEAGSIEIYVNYTFQGEMVSSGLTQPLRWVLDLALNNCVTATASTPPKQRTSADDPYVKRSQARRAGRRRAAIVSAR
jgi:hypothetical protein